MVDSGVISEGQKWATEKGDGRHFEAIVPLELFAFLSLLTTYPASYPA